MKAKVLEFYRKYRAENGKAPTMRVAAVALGISHVTVACHVEMIIRDGDMVRNHHKIYMARNGKMIETRRAHNEKANQQKSDAGKAGAEALKKRSLETGISRFNPGLAKDARKIEANIEAIVRKAEEKGTLYRPRPVYVVLKGEQVG